MNLKVESLERNILNNITDKIENGYRKTDEYRSYSILLEFYISELLRREMRQRAQNELEFEDEKEFFDEVVDDVERKIEKELESNHIDFDFKRYSKKLKEDLEKTAEEIFKLNKKLIEYKNKGGMSRKDLEESKSGVKFEIIELGLQDSIEGLLARPIEDSFKIDLDEIKKIFEYESGHFPFELVKDDIIYVIDDDGKIFVSNENLGKKLKEDIKEEMKNLAEQIYLTNQSS